MADEQEQMTPEQHQARPPSEYDDNTIEHTLDSMPDSKMRYKKPGGRGTHYRGGPYAGLTETEDGKLTHSADAAKRDDPVPHDPVSKRFGNLAVGNRAEPGSTDANEGGALAEGPGNNGETREYDNFTKHSQFNDYAKTNNITTPDRWSQMSVEDKKGWLDENT